MLEFDKNISCSPKKNNVKCTHNNITALKIYKDRHDQNVRVE